MSAHGDDGCSFLKQLRNLSLKEFCVYRFILAYVFVVLGAVTTTCSDDGDGCRSDAQYGTCKECISGPIEGVPASFLCKDTERCLMSASTAMCISWDLVNNAPNSGDGPLCDSDDDCSCQCDFIEQCTLEYWGNVVNCTSRSCRENSNGVKVCQ